MSCAGGFCFTVAPIFLLWLGCDLGDFLGIGWTQFIHPDDRDITRAAVEALQAQSAVTYTQRWISQSGVVLWLAISAWVRVRPCGQRWIVGYAKRVEEATYGHRPGYRLEEDYRDRETG